MTTYHDHSLPSQHTHIPQTPTPNIPPRQPAPIHPPHLPPHTHLPSILLSRPLALAPNSLIDSTSLSTPAQFPNEAPARSTNKTRAKLLLPPHKRSNFAVPIRVLKLGTPARRERWTRGGVWRRGALGEGCRSRGFACVCVCVCV
ncbi:hypothetical protein K505DRAFT_71994 [Melanomma pulvis-pyrius CBS 109.77]|uniref:Uncharacterized protein n=1 Tax=Melanomma pulvis-pyrius CBS 109.77 TaxID=1314802 RepID=A0A6A6X587_9PLEO|nr:hypothetical protein K505DRAFT_71994 [Melanomma pulvis-pyrius CBS 109.77]